MEQLQAQWYELVRERIKQLGDDLAIERRENARLRDALEKRIDALEKQTQKLVIYATVAVFVISILGKPLLEQVFKKVM